MDTFDFPYHQLSWKYPDDAARMQFGKGYQFASKPEGPPQRTFTLTFPALFWKRGNPPLGIGRGPISDSVDPQNNILTLIKFYDAHGLYEKFLYVHPVEGPITVRFAQPLEIPTAVVDGGGMVTGVTVTLLEQP